MKQGAVEITVTIQTSSIFTQWAKKEEEMKYVFSQCELKKHLTI